MEAALSVPGLWKLSRLRCTLNNHSYGSSGVEEFHVCQWPLSRSVSALLVVMQIRGAGSN